MPILPLLSTSATNGLLRGANVCEKKERNELKWNRKKDANRIEKSEKRTATLLSRSTVWCACIQAACVVVLCRRAIRLVAVPIHIHSCWKSLSVYKQFQLTHSARLKRETTTTTTPAIQRQTSADIGEYKVAHQKTLWRQNQIDS